MPKDRVIQVTESDGYAGSILYVDLSRGSVNRQPVPEDLKRQFLGGWDFGVKLVSDLVPADADALGPENFIVFATGPLTGTGVPLGGRHQVVSKSPLNDTLCSSDSGAFFGHELKVAGFDAVVFSGKSEKPVFLWINHGSAGRSVTRRPTGE